MDLGAIDWDEAIRAAEGGSIRLPAHAAIELRSLSALFVDDFAEAVGRVLQARSADPFNPIHQARLALVFMRFGDWDAAAEVARSLAEAEPGSALAGYLWGLATLRRDEPKRAANIAQDVAAAHPGFGLARFLHAESAVKTQLKGARKHLVDLPKGPPQAPAWADLLAKMLLSGSDDLAKLARPLMQDPGVLPAGSKPAGLVGLAASLATDPPERLEERLGEVPAGSRAEEVVLLALHDRLRAAEGPEAARRLRLLVARYPGRAAVRRLYVGQLAALAVAEAAAERHPDALRLVEACLRLEPHETAHYQNRAALFTLMREPDAYHDAWAELNRHEYRLALLGKVGPVDAIRLAKPHRLFAQEARLSAQGTGGVRVDSGVFVEDVLPGDSGPFTSQRVNVDRLAQDPEILRQWVHHHRAELVFNHLTLGPDPRRFLLNPENPVIARARLAGLARSAGSLGVLVPVEGRMLADRIVAGWTRSARRVTSAYADPPEDPEVDALGAQYLATLGDLVVLCLNERWPDGRRPELAEEVLDLLAAVAPFFDDRSLARTMKGSGGPVPPSIGRLAGYVHRRLGLESTPDRPLTQAERDRVTNGLAVEVLTSQAYRAHSANKGRDDRLAVTLELVERARGLDPDNLVVLITAAEFYLAGSYFAEAEAMLARAQRSGEAKTEGHVEKLDALKAALDERRKAEGKGLRREEPADRVERDEAPAVQFASLQEEIERFPSAIQSYENLVRELVGGGRFAEALEWTALAMGRCTARDSQVRARSLDLEARGLAMLGKRDQNAVRLYLAGVHRPALEAIGGMSSDEAGASAVWYVRGQCHLAVHQPEEARRAFEAALAACDRSSHRVVLRRLAADVDQAYLLFARQVIQDKVAVGAFEEALVSAGEMMGRLRRPEAALVDLARVHSAAAFARFGAEAEPLPRPAGTTIEGPEGDALALAYEGETDRGRARRIAEVGLRVDPDSAPRLEDLLRRLDTLDAQAEVVDLLARSGAMLREGRLAEALAALEGGSIAAEDPRALRQRALILLRLERFDEADAAADRVRGLPAAADRDLVAEYPRLAFRQRVATASRLIRAGGDADALAVLDRAVPGTDDERAELAYCRGFSRAMSGYRLRRQGRKLEARRALLEALRLVEDQVGLARTSGHSRLLELYDALESDPDLATLGDLT